MFGVLILAIRSDTVRRAVHQERIRSTCGDLWYINRGEQVLPIAHGDAEFVLRVVGPNVVFGRHLGRGWLLGTQRDEVGDKNGQNDGEEDSVQSEHRELESPDRQ